MAARRGSQGPRVKPGGVPLIVLVVIVHPPGSLEPVLGPFGMRVRCSRLAGGPAGVRPAVSTDALLGGSKLPRARWVNIAPRRQECPDHPHDRGIL